MASAVIYNKNSVVAVIKGIIIAVIVSLLGIIIHALSLKFFNLSENMIPIVNQITKGLSIFVGSFLSIRGLRNGWAKGLIIGIIYMIVGYTMFSILYGEFSANITLLNDVVLGAVTGILSGVICANIGSKKNSN